MTSPPESEAAMAEPSAAELVKARELLERALILGSRYAYTPSEESVAIVAAALSESRASAEGKARAEERAYIVEQIREHAPDLVLFAGGNTRPLSLLAWLLELPPAPKASGR